MIFGTGRLTESFGLAQTQGHRMLLERILQNGRCTLKSRNHDAVAQLGSTTEPHCDPQKMTTAMTRSLQLSNAERYEIPAPIGDEDVSGGRPGPHP